MVPEPELAELGELANLRGQILELVVLEVEAGELPALPDLGGQVLCGSACAPLNSQLSPLFRIRIHVFLGLQDQDPLVRGMDTEPTTCFGLLIFEK
jgi:hypothetical protein